MSMLDLSKIKYTSLFQGLGNLPPLEYEFDIAQINATKVGVGAAAQWIIPAVSYTFTMPVERTDVLSSLLFSIRDVDTELNQTASGRYVHSWNIGNIDDSTETQDEYLTRFESMRGAYVAKIGENTSFVGAPPFDYFCVQNWGLNYPTPGDLFPALSIRTWLEGENLKFNLEIESGPIAFVDPPANSTINKAITAATLRVKIKRYIAPWNV